MLTLKQLKQRNIVENLLSEIQVCLTLAIILEISYSDLETGKYGPNLESPRLPRRVDSTAHITTNILPIACTVIRDKLTGKISAQLHRFIMHAAIKLFMSYCFTQIDIMQNKCMNADIQIPETQLQALLPFPAPLPECPRELARRLAQFRPCMV